MVEMLKIPFKEFKIPFLNAQNSVYNAQNSLLKMLKILFFKSPYSSGSRRQRTACARRCRPSRAKLIT